MEISKLISGAVQKIIEKKDVFLVVVVLLIAFVSAVILFGDYSSKMASYKDQMGEKSKKLELIAAYNKVKDNTAAFKASLSKSVSADEIINEIANYAAKEGVEIVNVNTRDPQSFDFYSVISINASIKAKDFKSLVAFFHEVEKSSYGLKILSWVGRLDKGEASSLQCEISLTATQVKNDS